MDEKDAWLEGDDEVSTPVTASGSPIRVEQPSTLIGPDERDARAETDTGQYYCVTERGGIVSRDARPLYATLAEWQSLAKAVKAVVYIPTAGGKRTEPLFGSRPLIDTSGAPDIVGQLIEILPVLSSLTELLANRGAVLDKVLEAANDGVRDLGLLISQRIHFVELLDRAAAMIDPGGPGGTYEERLDWLAKWREVVGR